MADISFIQKPRIERVLEMQSGYVLDFSNNSFRDFVAESSGLDIYSERYENHSGSKANRLRKFFQVESNYVVGKLLLDLLSYRENLPNYSNPWKEKVSQGDVDFVRELANALIQEHGYVEVADIPVENFHDSFRLLRNSVDLSIKNDDPISGIDRLHTFLIEYTRMKLNKFGIDYNEHKSLNAVFGKVVNFYQENNFMQTPMSIRLLRTSISNIEAFNRVRNDHSLAHGNNNIINKNEAKLIYNSIISLINYIESFDPEGEQEGSIDDDILVDDDFPF